MNIFNIQGGIRNGILLIIIMNAMACKERRNLYPEELIGGLVLLDPANTGIDFNNAIQESEKVNHLYNSQIYNGAGVAIGDLNNDGLADVFFCGNMVNDRLYLNKGDFKFEDITNKAGVGLNQGWSWGATMADVNADGLLDIYVSRSGESMNPEDRRNQLYINNGDLSFTESAVLFGLADLGFSSQAVFFDMDNDNDLDMYQVNQPPDPRLFFRYKIPKERQKFHTDKLYQNENGKYQDVSKSCGVGALAHGLSVSAADFNNDGWVDLYVANDYDEPDLMYYNNGNGKFTNVINEKLKHISHSSMGTDAGDINNDGFLDLITLDMAAEDHYRSKTNMGSMSTSEFMGLVSKGKHYQYMSNTLQLNTGNGNFYDIASMTGLAKTDWSWGALLVDLDNDGWKDVIVTNGIKKDIRNNDFLVDIRKELNSGSKEFLNMSIRAPSEPLSNYIFRNSGDMEFEKVAKKWGFDTPGYSSGVAYGDLDNDGDLDIITNNMDAPAFVYENKANGNYLKVEFKGPDKNKWGIGAKAIIHSNGNIQVAEHSLTRGYFSSVAPGLFFGLGKNTEVEKAEIIWPDGKVSLFENKEANTTLIVNYDEAKLLKNSVPDKEPIFKQLTTAKTGILFTHKENDFNDFAREILLPHKLSQNGPFIARGDVNGDSLKDVFIGGAASQSGILYLQQKNGQFVKSASQPWELENTSEDLGCLFLDIDGDSDQDLIVASGGSEFEKGSSELQDRIYVNNGQGGFKYDPQALPSNRESSQCVKAADVDADGDLDLFIGTRLIAGKYPHPASSYLLINENGKYRNAAPQIAPDLRNIGMVTDAVFTDIDKDGDPDLLMVGEWMQITLLENQLGVFVNSSDEWDLTNTRGLWWSITAGDFDNDGDDDFIVGNLGRNNKFKASEKHPFMVYANDFDDNGTNDIVLAKFYKNDYVPMRGRQCTSEQMPYVAEKFKDYKSFASSKLLDILPANKSEKGVVYEVSNFESILLINNNGKLERKTLPNVSQVSPIKAALVTDVNRDGHMDIITVGNHYAVEVETTRYDAGIGTVLLGDGKNNFEPVSTLESGFYVPYDSRDIQLINTKSGNLILITNNNDSTTSFTF